jgi:hypothetical protein
MLERSTGGIQQFSLQRSESGKALGKRGETLAWLSAEF